LPDVGLSGDPARNKFWNRQSIVRLWNDKFGEIRLGRDYSPTYASQIFFDSFGNSGLGNLLNTRQMYNGTRLDNSVGYVLPTTLGGLYGEVKASADEEGKTFDRPGRYVGGRLGYRQGGFDVAAAVGRQRFSVAFPGGGTPGNPPALNNGQPIPAPAGSAQKTWNIATSYDWGEFKLQALYDREELLSLREGFFSISGIARMGASEIHAGYDRSKLTNGTSTTIDQLKIRYVYNLSKRTAVYGTVARIDNKDATTGTLPTSPGPAAPGGTSRGLEAGVRHFF